MEAIEQMAFADAVALFEYWAEFPPVHLMVRGYLGYEGKESKGSPQETAQALKLMAGGRRAKKMDMASPRVQSRFAQLKKTMKQLEEEKKKAS